jgi:hypothetical protein
MCNGMPVLANSSGVTYRIAPSSFGVEIRQSSPGALWAIHTLESPIV